MAGTEQIRSETGSDQDDGFNWDDEEHLLSLLERQHNRLNVTFDEENIIFTSGKAPPRSNDEETSSSSKIMVRETDSSSENLSSSRSWFANEESCMLLPEESPPCLDEHRAEIKRQKRELIELKEEQHNNNHKNNFTNEQLRHEVETLMMPRTDRIQRPAGSVRVFRNFRQSLTTTESERGRVEKRLPEDTFSFVMIAKMGSFPFYYATMIAFFQFSVYVLVCVNVISAKDKTNPIGFPANVPPSVRIAEFIALVILIPLQDELLEAFILLNDGYESKVFETKFLDASKSKFILSIAMRLVVGLLSILTSFLLIMIEEDVMEIFFNFIALQFINDLDNLGFRFASEGIIGFRVQAEATRVSDVSYYTDRAFHRRLPLVCLFLLVMGGWAWVVALQENGRFVSESVEVQFGDDIDSALGTFSGVYSRTARPSRSGRFHYYDQNPQSKAFFGYCESNGAWTFTYEGNDPCNFKARSEKTETYEITDTVAWFVGTPVSRAVPLVPFFMDCFRCADEINPCRNGGTLSVSDRSSCRCPSSHFGRRCEFNAPCMELNLDTSSGEWLGPENFPTDFHAIERDEDGEVVVFNEKPVYLDQDMKTLVVAYNGRRWMATSIFGFNVTSVEDMVARMDSGIQLFYSQVNSLFMSEPTDIGSPDDEATPINLRFYRTTDPSTGMQRPLRDEMQPVHFTCKVCDAVLSPCKFGNPCVNGTCQCLDGTSGYHCEQGPWRDAQCNLAFNTIDFTYDGGDCCAGTCKSTVSHFCGYEDRVEIGFPHCIDLAFSCAAGSSPCWAPNAERYVMRKVASSANNNAFIQLAANGRIMAVTYPNVGVIEVLDKVDNQWIPRGDTMTVGSAHEFLGASVALSPIGHDHGSVLDLVASPLNVRLAISISRGRIIRVVEWSAERWLLVTEIVTSDGSSGTGGNFDFFGHGRYLAVEMNNGISIFDVEDTDQPAETRSCSGLVDTTSCSLTAVSNSGSLLIQSTSNEVFHFISIVSAPNRIDSGKFVLSMLSRDGEIVAMVHETGTDELRIQFFSIRRQDDKWRGMGNDLVVPRGFSIGALSVDGHGVAFVKTEDNGARVKVYRYDSVSASWYELGDEIPTKLSPSISLSGDASEMAIADSSGKLQSLSLGPVCQPGESEYRIFLIMENDQFARWSLRVPPAANNTRSQHVLHTESPVYGPGPLKALQTVCLPNSMTCPLLEYTTTRANDVPDGNPLLSVRMDHQEVLRLSPASYDGSFAVGVDC